MKNIRNIALALVAVLLVGFLAVSCDDASLNDLIRHGDHTHVLGTKHEAVASTCMAKGSVEWYECEDETCLAQLDADCKALKTVEVDIDPNAHAKGTNHSSTAGDCQTKGTIEYWDCSNGCGSKIDADCKALTSIEGQLGSHVKGEGLLYHAEVVGDCQTNGTVEYWECSVEGCDKNLDENAVVLTSIEGQLGPHNKGTYHASTAGDCQTNSTVEYWECSVEGCDKKLDTDAAALTSIEGQLGPHVKGQYHAGTNGDCQTNRTLEYWDCSVQGCGQMIDKDCVVMTTTVGTINTAFHPAGATTTWTKNATTHTETYDCCNAVKTEGSHSFVAGVCVCGQTIPVSSITLNKTTMTISAGANETLTATVSPSDAANKTVNWSSSDTSKATVDASGKVTGVAAGSVTITATAADGSGVSASCTVTVSDLVAVSLPCRRSGSPHIVMVRNGELWSDVVSRYSFLKTNKQNDVLCEHNAFWYYHSNGTNVKSYSRVDTSDTYDQG